MPAKAVYKSLAEGQFRLLNVKSLDGRIECKLEPHVLKDAPHYDALSYAWDKDDKRESTTVHVNEIPIVVTPNLHDALLRLSSYLPETSKTCLIWIDALCINQKNKPEKNIQLPLMSEIYSSAQRVLVFLGRANRNSDLVMECMDDVGQKLTRVGRPIFLDDLSTYGLKDKTDDLWPAIGHFCRRSWWERLWILQEVILARTCIVMCGEKVVAWKLLTVFLESLVATELKNLALARHFVRKDISDAFSTVSHINILASRAGGPPIADLLLVSRLRLCEMHVDRIWGFIGVMAENDRKHVRESKWIQYPDDIDEGNNQVSDDSETAEAEEARKQGPYWESYIKVMKWALQKDSTLRLLSLAPSESRPDELPTWCANWSSNQGHNPFGEVKKYNAGTMSPGTVSAVVLFPNSNNIGVSGFKVDEVHKTVDDRYHFTWSQFPADRRGPTGSAAKVLEWESKCLELSRETYHGQALNSTEPSDIVPEEHWRTIVGDKVSDMDTRSLPEVFGQTYQTWKDLLISLRDNRDYPGHPDDLTVINAYSHWVENACTGRKFFSTTGGSVGIGPVKMREGDHICVFESGRPVYVLRRKKSTESVYELLGDAFVFGLMSGQALAMPGLDREIFVLC